jgi:type VI secretion system protein ImpK
MTIDTQQRTAASILDSKNTSEANLPMNTHSYYRSRICTVHTSLNPLVAAASPIYTIMSQIRYLPTDTDLNQLQQNLFHEICAFESSAIQQKYRPKIITAAKYALCCFIDEGIQQCPQFASQSWTSLLTMMHDEKEDKWQFYVILEHTTTDPHTYIDLLELLYLCLSLGYEGQYKNNEHGFIIRENIINNLYKVIRDFRGNAKPKIIVSTSTQKMPRKKALRQQLIATTAMTVAFLGIVLGCGYLFLQRSSNDLEIALSETLNTTASLLDTTPMEPMPMAGEVNGSCCAMSAPEST